MTEHANRQRVVVVQKVAAVPAGGSLVFQAMTKLNRSTSTWRLKQDTFANFTGTFLLETLRPDRTGLAGEKLRHLFGGTGKLGIRPMGLGMDETRGRPDGAGPRRTAAAAAAAQVVEEWFGHVVQVEDDNSVWVDLEAPTGERERALFTSEDFTAEQWPDVVTGRAFKYTRLREAHGTASTEIRRIEIVRGEPVGEARREQSRAQARDLLRHARRA